MSAPCRKSSPSLSTLAVLAALLALFGAPGRSAAQSDASDPGTRFLRQPDVSATRIAFVHANDIWTVGRDGGRARRLTSARGAETDPHFSPDGRWIAFTGEYAGDEDVYVVAADGGQPVRLTWHPGSDVAQGWTPDGRILFRSSRDGAPTRLWRFWTVSPEGGLPTPLALPQAYEGEMSADGRWVAYQEIGYWDPEWRNYRGGQAQPAAVVSTSTWERSTAPQLDGERHMAPVWLDGRVYYMSERDYASNVWSWDPGSGDEEQHTFHADFDVKSLGAGGGVVVYEQAGYLHELDPATGETRQLVVHADADQNWARPRWEEVPSTELRDVRLSPTGKRAVFEQRGEIFTAPAGEGSWRNITRSPGVADRHPVWSPDGERIAWFSDEGGEYGLVVADQLGRDMRRIPIPDPTFFFQPTWSPDGTRLAFTDTDYRVLILELESGDLTHVDTDRYAHPERSTNPVWSPDSRWIAYARRLDTQFRAVFVHDTRTGETHQLTDGMADAIDPVWDASGDYLWFLASTDFGLNTGWLDMTSYDRPVTRALYLAVLDADDPSPFLPQSAEEGDEGDAGFAVSDGSDGEAESGGEAGSRGGPDGGSARQGGGAGGPDADVVVSIDFDGIERRILGAPGLPVRNHVALVPGPAGQVFVLESVPNEQGATVHRYSVEDREATEFMTGVQTLVASHDRKKVLVGSGPSWRVVDAAGPPPGAAGGEALELADLRVKVDPKAEWAQMLRDGWRFMRDFLYVDNVHGAPWDDVWQWYSAWLPDVEHRSDFNHLLDMLSGEVAVGHSYVRGGDYPELDSPRTGLLGVDIEEDDGFYRITRVYTGEDWNPDLIGPLAHPGMGVEAGDYIVAIQGEPLRAPDNPYRLLEGTAGRVISVAINDRPSLEGARELWVEPTSSENGLRTWAWVTDNQERVDELSGGRLAYVWLPNTGGGGYTFFNRMYFAQQDRDGAIIDERNNGGGSAADYIVEVLDRELTGYFNSRTEDRTPWTQPMAGLFGPKVMVINERAGSGGDLLPYLFRFKDIGPLVGTRTWGGLVGTWDTPPLIDGGRFVAPRGGFFDVDGEWAVEGVGVAPDIEVRNDPAPVIAGRDPQLEAAVAEALRLLETEGVELQDEPPAPVRWRRPETGGGDGAGA
ncbi:MAG: S41 family peptidase [Candidatus Longimicrobiales bacterium M2_2A_002]